jgi:hypothetical protein
MSEISQKPSFRALVGFASIALTLLLLQVVLSRLLAATLTYYYAFMLISLAMLGLAAGGMTIRLFPNVMPTTLVWRQASVLSAAMGLATFAGTLGMLAVYPAIKFNSVSDLYRRTPWALARIIHQV